MDIALIKTFLETADTGSFVAASDRLFGIHSAVSLRCQRLETAPRQALFPRSQAGGGPMPLGRESEHYALFMVRICQEARQQIARRYPLSACAPEPSWPERHATGRRRLGYGASWPEPDLGDLVGRHAPVDWAPDFLQAQAMA